MDLSSSSRSSKRKREAFRMRWRFLEDAGFFALRALGKRPGLIQESKLKFQCLLCPFRSLESLPDSFFSCSHSSISNLKKHVRRIHGHRFAEFQEVMKRRQKSKKGEKQKLIQLDFQISTKSDSDDNDDSDDGTQHRNKPAPVADMTRELLAPLVKFLEDFGYFSLVSSKKDSSSLVFQCLMCDDSKDSKVTCSESSLANLGMHVQRNHPERSEDFNREVTEIQKRGQVGVVHDDDDDGEVPEVHDRAVQMHSEDQQQASGYPWDFLFQDFFRLTWSAGSLEDRNSLLRFRCLLCEPESPPVSCNRSSLSNLKRHVWRKHQAAFEKLDALWRANVIKTGGKRNPETGERMYDSDNDDSNAYDNDDDADDDALFSSNVFQPQVTLKEEYVEMDSAKYPWNFLETSGYFTLIGSTLLDVNDRQSTLRFQCLLCNPSEGMVVSCSGGSLSNLKKHVLRVHPQSYEDLENLWKMSMKEFQPSSSSMSASRPRQRDDADNVESD